MSTAPIILHRITNAAEGLESTIVAGRFGFHVALRDLDADEFVPAVECFPVEADALAYAKEIAGLVARPAGTVSVSVSI